MTLPYELPPLPNELSSLPPTISQSIRSYAHAAIEGVLGRRGEPVTHNDCDLSGQFERSDIENHRLRRAMQKIMARLTELLDEDQFAAIEGIATDAGVEPPAEPVKVPSVRDLIVDDSYAATFQSIGQYRAALLREISSRYGQPAQPAKSSLSVKYDSKGDCLYVTCDSNEPAHANEDEHGILRRHARSDGRLVGITIPDFAGRKSVASAEPSNIKENE